MVAAVRIISKESFISHPTTVDICDLRNWLRCKSPWFQTPSLKISSTDAIHLVEKPVSSAIWIFVETIIVQDFRLIIRQIFYKKKRIYVCSKRMETAALNTFSLLRNKKKVFECLFVSVAWKPLECFWRTCNSGQISGVFRQTLDTLFGL